MAIKKTKKAVKKAVKPVEVKPEPVKPVEVKPEPVKPVEIKAPVYKVAPGKSITSKKGILGPGEEVKAEYMSGGQKTIDDRIESGHITKG